MTLTFTLPLPPRGCSSNGNKGGSWGKKAMATKGYRTAGYLYGRQTLMVNQWHTPAKARMSLVFCTKGARDDGSYAPRDISNAIAAFKGAQDGLVDSGCLVADDAKHLVLGEVTIDSNRGPWVEVTLEAMSPSQGAHGGAVTCEMEWRHAPGTRPGDCETRDCHLDEGIVGIVNGLWSAGVVTVSSCQGGGTDGHGWDRYVNLSQVDDVIARKAVAASRAMGMPLEYAKKIYAVFHGADLGDAFWWHLVFDQWCEWRRDSPCEYDEAMGHYYNVADGPYSWGPDGTVWQGGRSLAVAAALEAQDA